MNASANTVIAARGIALYAEVMDLPYSSIAARSEVPALVAWDKFVAEQGEKMSQFCMAQQFNLFDLVNSRF